MESKITYFEEIRPENTDVAFKLVQERFKGSGIKKVVFRGIRVFRRVFRGHP